MLARQITQKLQAAIAQVPAVALLGARQVGKTTLAKAIAKDIDSIYLDLQAQRICSNSVTPVAS